MGTKRRHARAEISAKLREADALVAQGKRQKDVASALGISVMTFHRWRKAQAEHSSPKSITFAPVRESPSDGDDKGLRERIAELQLENARLRRLVTDFLLEKVKLQEAAASVRASDDELTGRPTH
jgi:putative transposase